MILQFFKKLVFNEDGQGMTEYAFVLGVIGAGALFLVKGVRDSIGDLYNRIALELKDYISNIN